ncbi:DUF3892 domain-containing protein [Desertibacillus haloalkaliphilus]|uniref:DUF3892 domain-containing protein n=1 Tax=Desertibacillus haloalkaliphilus TaxID=1328930 RepID=UPI001C265A23|nr:DUF3892 domain-containing protein [Desertibacillus haloalkaliphilus]MBU8907533.1 DUF3892 domain-containing protein [Desertibacillus haloalkaliphilus]
MDPTRQETFVAVRKNNEGDIVELKTSAGRILDYRQAQEEVQNGTIIGANVFTGRDGDPHLRSNADDNPDNNLDNLPHF